MYYTSLPLSPCQPQFLVHSHNLRTITFHPTILTSAHNYPQSPHNSHKSHNPDKSLQISSNAHLLVSAWLTLIPCSSKIAKYSDREMDPFPSLSTWNTEKLVRNIISSFSLLHPPPFLKNGKNKQIFFWYCSGNFLSNYWDSFRPFVWRMVSSIILVGKIRVLQK